MRRAAVAFLFVLALAPCGAASADDERLRSAKALVFDGKFTEARQAWQALLATSQGRDADTAAYWVARCSENLKESERALKEYGQYLERRPADETLVQEAKTSRVGLAARLYKSGQTQYLSVLKDGLGEGTKTIRYYAALQLGSLGAPVGLPSVPVLQRIVQEEHDDDLVERAKILLLKLDPKALPHAEPTGEKGASKPATWIRVRIYEKGSTTPEVSVNMPVALAELVFKSLPDDARKELKLKGYDADTFWERLKKLGPTEILNIQGKDSERVQIWLE